jgi:hypothetical protein
VTDPQAPSVADPEVVLALLGEWEHARLRELRRKVIHRLSRMPASGLFSEYRYESLWGEYAHDVQNGDDEGFSLMLHDMAEDACEAVAETVPTHEMRLFDRLAEACGDIGGRTGITYLVERLKEEVSSAAAMRNLDRYAEDYRWYENL